MAIAKPRSVIITRRKPKRFNHILDIEGIMADAVKHKFLDVPSSPGADRRVHPSTTAWWCTTGLLVIDALILVEAPLAETVQLPN